MLDPGRLTLVVEGDLAACRAALDAGSAAAQRTGRVISRKEIGRPEEDTQWLVGGFARATTPTESARYPQRLSSPKRYWRCWHQYAGNDGGRGGRAFWLAAGAGQKRAGTTLF